MIISGSQNPPKKPLKIGPNRHFASQNVKILQWQYLQNSKSNQVEICSSTGDHEVLIQKYKIRLQGSVAWVTWPTFKFWDPPNMISLEWLKVQTWNFACGLMVS